MLSFESHRQPGPHHQPAQLTSPTRSYRELTADGMAELDAERARHQTPAACPHCGAELNAITTPELPEGMPRRSPDDAVARAAALEATARRLAAVIRDALPAGTFAIWVGPLVLADAAAGRLYFAAPAHLASWAAERYAPLLDRAATRLAGHEIQCIVFAGTAPGRSLLDLTSANESPAGD